MRLTPAPPDSSFADAGALSAKPKAHQLGQASAAAGEPSRWAASLIVIWTGESETLCESPTFILWL